jgi:hypothetical protein
LQRLIDESVSVSTAMRTFVRDACDNCPYAANAAAIPDFDHDGSGDACDLNDGLIYVSPSTSSIARGKASRATRRGTATADRSRCCARPSPTPMAPGSNALARRDCGVTDTFVDDAVVPGQGEVAFHLVTGVSGGTESGLGTNSAGSPRPTRIRAREAGYSTTKLRVRRPRHSPPRSHS